jgi:hypothetical protein
MRTPTEEGWAFPPCHIPHRRSRPRAPSRPVRPGPTATVPAVQMGFWEVADVAASGGAVLVAVLVFREARSIRTMEWLSRSIQMWQSFNQMLLDEERAVRWRRLLDGSLPAAEIKMADHYVLFTYVNIIFAEYQFARQKLINRDYALESVADNLKQLVPNGGFIIPLLRFTGYDNEFVDLIERVAAGGDAGAREWIRTRRHRWPWQRQ